MTRPDWCIVEVTYRRDSYQPYSDIYGPFKSLADAVEFKLELELPQEHNAHASITVGARRISEPNTQEIRRTVRDFLQ